MLVLSAKNLTKAYGVDVIINDVYFSVNKNDRIGIVGPNGAGKTTLLKMLAGETDKTDGNIFIKNGCSVGYLKQDGNFNMNKTVIEEVDRIYSGLHDMEIEIEELSEKIADSNSPKFQQNLDRYSMLQEEYRKRGGYAYKSEMKSVLRSMNFDESFYNKEISTLSGGERTRLALVCILLKSPDILMLDEPTNHLDLPMLAWLEQYLKNYNGTILLVSHDRYFLDQLTNRTFEVEGKKITTYAGNYSEYAVKHAERLEIEQKEYEKQQKEIAKQEDLVRRFKQRGTEKLVKRAQSREKKLDKIKPLDRPHNKKDRIKVTFKTNYESGNDVLLTENLCKTFGTGKEKKEIFKDVSIDIKKGEKVCIIGNNGVGKTTLLKILMEKDKPDDGYLKVGHNVDFGYYDQGQLLLNPENTVLGELKESYHLYTDTDMRSILGRFLFRKDDVFKEIKLLSGGEKARLALLKLMLSGANTLVLDEPTNHLDIDAREIFEEELQNFAGTLIIVSHDRYFLNKVPTRILELTHDGMEEYLGKYDYYKEKKKTSASEPIKNERFNENRKNIRPYSAEEERQEKKEKETEKRRKIRTIEKLEKEIKELEKAIVDIEKEMCKSENISRPLLLNKYHNDTVIYKKELDEKYEMWMELQ